MVANLRNPKTCNPSSFCCSHNAVLAVTLTAPQHLNFCGGCMSGRLVIFWLLNLIATAPDFLICWGQFFDCQKLSCSKNIKSLQQILTQLHLHSWPTKVNYKTPILLHHRVNSGAMAANLTSPKNMQPPQLIAWWSDELDARAYEFATFVTFAFVAIAFYVDRCKK